MFLKKKFGSQSLIADWAWNIIHCCKDNSSIDLRIFNDLLSCKLDFSILDAIEDTIKEAKSIFYTLDEQHLGVVGKDLYVETFVLEAGKSARERIDIEKVS
jgi:hypothetical protein